MSARTHIPSTRKSRDKRFARQIGGAFLLVGVLSLFALAITSEGQSFTVALTDPQNWLLAGVMGICGCLIYGAAYRNH